MFRAIKRIGLIVSTALLMLACSSSQAPDDASLVRGTTFRVANSRIYIKGVTWISQGTVRAAGPGEDTVGVSILENYTEWIRGPDGEELLVGDVPVGSIVEAEYGGTVLRSLPLQVRAQRVRLLSVP